MYLFRKLLDGMTAATIAVLIIATGAAALAVSATTSNAPTNPSLAATEATSVTTVDVGGQVAIPVDEIGVATVARSAAELELVSAIAEPGWQVLVEVATGRELDVSFRSDGVRHDLNVELEDGQLRIRIRTSTGQLEDNSAAASSTSTTTPGSSSSTSSTLPSSSTTLPPTPAGAEPRDITVLDAGSVTYIVDGTQLKIVDVAANDGWSPSVEISVGREVEVSFRNSGARVDLNLELEDNQVRIRIRDRRTDTRTEVRVPANGSSSGNSSTSTSTTSTVPSSSTTTPSDTSDSSAPIQRAIASAGGTVVVSIAGNSVVLVSASPADGYSADIRKDGPDEVDVRFEAGDAESRIEVRVQNGQVRQDVEDR